MKDQNVYRKLDNGRYQPYGVCYEPDNLPDGIWYVRHHEYSREMSNIKYLQGLFKVGDSEQVNIPQLCGLADYADEILRSEEFSTLMGKGYSVQDIVTLTVSKVFEINKRIEEKKR